jgi:hypothetical protein
MGLIVKMLAQTILISSEYDNHKIAQYNSVLYKNPPFYSIKIIVNFAKITEKTLILRSA